MNSCEFFTVVCVTLVRGDSCSLGGQGARGVPVSVQGGSRLTLAGPRRRSDVLGACTKLGDNYTSPGRVRACVCMCIVYVALHLIMPVYTWLVIRTARSLSTLLSGLMAPYGL